MQLVHPETAYKVLAVKSSVFNDNGFIPRKYTCDGEDISPPIEIGEVPRNTKSLVLMVEDPDAPSGNWLHWLVYNIPVTHQIAEGEIPGDQGVNDFGRIYYGGPCPPSGTHHYHFKMYALDDTLNVSEGATRSEIDTVMQNHIIAFGETVGLYKKPGKGSP